MKNRKEGKMRAARYARVSTEKQAEKYGLPSQIEELDRRCLEENWAPVFDGVRCPLLSLLSER